MNRWFGWLLALSGAALAGCGVNLPEQYPLSDYSKRQILGQAEEDEPLEIDPKLEDKIADILEDHFGTPQEPWMKARHMSDAEADNVAAGSILYQRHCIHCHGLTGNGAGPTAPFLFPRPRDYRRGVFKWKSTVRNAKPTRDDLLTVVREGAIGTSMPPFKLMSDKELNQLVDYVMFLSKRGELERKLLLAVATGEDLPDAAGVDDMITEINNSWKTAGEQTIAAEGARPALAEGSTEYEASLARGKALYLGERAACYKCHNNDGQADPTQMAEEERKKNVDDWGNPNYPRNLTLGMFRGGRRPIDVYRRIHQGIAGASMPEGAKNLKPQEIWDLVNLVRAVPYRRDVLPQAPPSAPVHGSEHAEGHGGGH